MQLSSSVVEKVSVMNVRSNYGVYDVCDLPPLTGIRDYLLENDFTCPKCSETDVSPDTLMANKALRTVSVL